MSLTANSTPNPRDEFVRSPCRPAPSPSYEYEQWVFFYQGLGPQLPNAPGPFLHDVGGCAVAGYSARISVPTHRPAR